MAFHSPPVSPSHRTDEDLINKSLLDSINADVDTSTTATRLSPASQHSHLSSYDHQQVSSSSHPIYSSRNSLDIMSPSSTNHPNPIASNYLHYPQPSYSHSQYRTDSFNYPTKADIFGPSTSDSRYDFDPYQQDPVSAQKQLTSYSTQLLKQQQSQSQQPSQPTSQAYVANGIAVNGGVPYLNGSHLQNGLTFSPSSHHHHHHPPPAQHSLLHAPGPGSGNPSQQSSSQHVPIQPPQQQSNRADQAQVQEEISTIFVVGFPDDMQEREFQNMFTFANGFEAATLKIPNKDSSAYGSTANASGVTNTLRQAGYINQQHAGSLNYSNTQDPYNLVTVNSGGVVVDGPQGTSSSWQQANSVDSFGADLQQQQQQHQQQSQQAHPPPRKQIIGFAKFRTRQEALEARDILQGRRVDIEKGAVLKAEMAKKNLHTKRGVGPLGLPVGLIPSTSSANTTVALSGVVSSVSNSLIGSSDLSGPVNSSAFGYTNGASVGLVAGQTNPGETLLANDRLSVTLDAPLNRRQHHQQEDEKEHDQREKRGMTVSTATPVNVARDEQEHEQIRRDSVLIDRNLRAVYDAFHSVPDASNLIGSNGLTMNGNVNTLGLPDSVTSFPAYSLGNMQVNNNAVLAHGSLSTLASKLHAFSSSGDAYLSPQSHHLSQAHNSAAPGTPWIVPNANASSSSAPPRPPSSLQSSPPSSFDDPYCEKRATYSNSSYTDPNGALSPPDLNTPLPFASGSQVLRLHSPGVDANGQQQQQQHYHSAVFSSFTVGSPSLPRSSSSSVADDSQGSSLGSLEHDYSSKVLTVTTEHDATSPQIPSPGSRASSAEGPAASTSTLPLTSDGRQAANIHSRQHYPGNASDQNPPINTLYVGNLPNSPTSGGYSTTVLEDSLRSLFSQCSGYRKLCFRQKSNGPMCFVEFEDVNYATKAMRDLYGNQLNGLVKGGIRLSFSKNPLGVRPSNPNGQSQSQRIGQQQQQLSGPHQSPTTVSNNSMNFSSMHDAFQSRASPSDIIIGGNRPILRHYDSSHAVGTSELGSPNHIYSYSISPPPTSSRFFSPPPVVGSGPGPSASNIAPSSMSSASSTSSTSASGASGPPFSSNIRTTIPLEFGSSTLSPTLSAQAYSPSFGMNLSSPTLESDDRAVRFARPHPISSSQTHSLGLSGSNFASLSSASSSNGAVSPGLQMPSLSPKK